MTAPQQTYPQVVLFGSIPGGWREKYVIPVLDQLGVTYYHPGSPDQTWTEEMGRREAEALKHCETIVMVINDTLPGFGGLAETGWAALGALQRGQTFILYVQPGFSWKVPGWLRLLPGARGLVKQVDEYATRSRVLVTEHARKFAGEVERLIVAETMEQVVAALRQRYGGGASTIR